MNGLADLAVRAFIDSRYHLKLRGGGRILKSLARAWPALRALRFPVSGAGTAILDLSDDAAYYLLEEIYAKNSEEAETLDALKASLRLKPKPVFWDVGGNVGAISLHIHRAVASATIVVFEPNPFHANSLRSLFLPALNIRVMDVALSDSNGRREFRVPNGSSPKATLEEIGSASGAAITVTLNTGDGLIEAGVPVPDVIKIDTEGHEPSVLRGLRRTLERHRPIVVFEHLFLAQDTIKVITPPDYRFAVIRRSGGLVWDGALDLGRNSVLVPVELLNVTDTTHALAHLADCWRSIHAPTK